MDFNDGLLAKLSCGVLASFLGAFLLIFTALRQATLVLRCVIQPAPDTSTAVPHPILTGKVQTGTVSLAMRATRCAVVAAVCVCGFLFVCLFVVCYLFFVLFFFVFLYTFFVTKQSPLPRALQIPTTPVAPYTCGTDAGLSQFLCLSFLF